MGRALFITIGLSILILAILPMVVIPSRASNLSTSSLIVFSISANPDSASLAVGTRTSVTIIVSSQGLNGPVDLATEVSSGSGLTASLSPSTVLVLPSGNANSTLSIDATNAQSGTYSVKVTGSSLLAASQETTIVTDVTPQTTGSPPINPPSSSNPPSGPSPPSGSGSSGSTGPSSGVTSTTTSGSGPKTTIGPKGGTPSSTSDPTMFLVAGNLLAAIATAAALTSLHRRKKQASLSSWQ